MINIQLVSEKLRGSHEHVYREAEQNRSIIGMHQNDQILYIPTPVTWYDVLSIEFLTWFVFVEEVVPCTCKVMEFLLIEYHAM